MIFINISKILSNFTAVNFCLLISCMLLKIKLYPRCLLEVIMRFVSFNNRCVIYLMHENCEFHTQL